MSDNPQRGEGFYMENGRKADAAIHDQIIAEADPAGVSHQKHVSFLIIVESGFDPQLAAQMLGIEGCFDLGRGSLG
jgi:hypothetical protein